MAFDLSAIGSQFFVGLSRSMILFIVTAGLSFVLGVLRVPNVAHGSLYMIGAFSAFSITKLVPGPAGFWLALLIAPLVVALVSFIAERALFCHLYQREHLMLLLFTFALSLILGDLVKLIWGAEYKSIMAPAFFTGSVRYFWCIDSQIQSVSPHHWASCGHWPVALHQQDQTGKDREGGGCGPGDGGAVGINVSWVFAFAFVFGCFMAGLGGALMAPTISITLGMDHNIIIEGFLIVTIGGLGNMWGAMVGSLIFGLTQAFGVLFWPQFAIVFPYAAVVIVLLLRPKGILKSVW